MEPRLSIVVPFFNVEPYIVACLQSLQRQAFEDFEAILVDDGSTDAGPELAAAFAQGDSRFRLITQENQGPGPARNRGVEKAQGELLAFVDGDDLVPRYGFTQLVSSLDETGSDLAAGDARRFSSLGVTESYSHREPFAIRRLATHVSEFPTLALDRMPWNKVYRRRFWDDNGLEFPAMLYEDYPVTIKSHVRASRVDVLPEPVYYWRERDGGELSITQRHWEVSNLRDRVVSAEMVLDLVEREAPYARELVQAHLFHIDVSALAAAVQEHADGDLSAILELVDRLCARISPEVRAQAIPFERVQHHLLANRRISELTELVRYRADHGTAAPVNCERRLRTRYFLALPFFAREDVGVPKAHYALDTSDLALDARVEDAQWADGLLHLELTAAPRLLRMGERSEVAVWLENEDGRRIPCPVTRHHQVRQHIGSDLSALKMVVNPLALSGGGKAFWRVVVRVRTESGLTREGTVRTTAPTRGRWIAAGMLDRSVWLQPRILNGDFGVWVGRRTQWVSRCSDFGKEIEISGAIRGDRLPDTTELVLTRGRDAELRYPVEVVEGDGRVHGFTAVVPVADLVRDSVHDSPVEEEMSWLPRLSLGGEMRPLATHPAFAGAVSTVGSRSVMATRNPRGMFTLLEGHAHPVTLDVHWVGRARLSFHGLTRDQEVLASGVVLRRYLTPTEVIETPVVDVRVTDGVFRFEVDVRELIRLADEPAGSVHGEGRSATPWHFVSPDPQRTLNLVMAREVAGDTAAPRRVRGHNTRVEIARGGVVRLLVG